MPDREKIINCLTDIEQIMVCRQEICPREELQYWIELQEGVADALELLKEQEAVEPKVSCTEQRCGNCNKVIEMDGWEACPWCGKMIDWERWWNENGTHDNT